MSYPLRYLASLVLVGVAWNLSGEDVAAAVATIPDDASKLLSSYSSDIAKIREHADKAVLARTDKVRPALIKAQEAATKRGDLEGALAIKAAIEALPTSADFPGGDPQLAKPAVAFRGSYSYSYPNGHQGFIDVTGRNVTDRTTGIPGTWAQAEKTITITWSNGTKWIMSPGSRGTYTSTSSDGLGTLTPEK